jgi:hypothetical protein
LITCRVNDRIHFAKDEGVRLKKTDTYYIHEPGRVFKAIVRGIVRAGFRAVLNLRSEKSDDIDSLEGATILIGNHLSAIDPFVMGAYVTKRWVHCKESGFPIIHDTLYGYQCEYDRYISRQALHSCSVSFIHPFTNEYITITSPLPEDMAGLEKAIKEKSLVND